MEPFGGSEAPPFRQGISGHWRATLIRGITSAASGMLAQLAQQDITANNLANVNTAGYKRDAPRFSAFLSGAQGAATTTSIDTQSAADFQQGAIQETGEPFHLALEGDGFFTLQTPAGTAYTRNGAFTLNKDGYLVTASGDFALGAGGPIHLTGTDFTVDGTGQITQKRAVVDTLRLAQFPDNAALVKTGGSLWLAPGGVAPGAAIGVTVHQGGLEGSNVSAVREMVSMITGLRAYEASQKAVQAQDETLDKLVNEVGRAG